MIAELWALAPVAWARVVYGRSGGSRLLTQALLLGGVFGGALGAALVLLFRKAILTGQGLSMTGGVALVLGATGALGVLGLGAAGNAPGRPAWPLLPVPARVRARAHLAAAVLAPVLLAAAVLGGVWVLCPQDGGCFGSGLAPVDGGPGAAPGRAGLVAGTLGFVLLGGAAMAGVHLHLARLGRAAGHSRAPGLLVLTAMLGPGFVTVLAGAAWGAVAAAVIAVAGVGLGWQGARPVWEGREVGAGGGAGLGAAALPVELAWMGWVLREALSSVLVVLAGLGFVLVSWRSGEDHVLSTSMLPWLWGVVVANPLSLALGARHPNTRHSPLALLPLSGRAAQAWVAAMAAGGGVLLCLAAGVAEPAVLLAAATSGVTMTLLVGGSRRVSLSRQGVYVLLFVLLPLPVQMVMERVYGPGAWPAVALGWSAAHLLASTALLALPVRT